jgi:hypothetical protein
VEEELDWQKLSAQKLTQLINSRNNPFLLLKVLFRLMRDAEWRRWSSFMQLLLQKLQNFVAADCTLIKTLAETDQLQHQLEYLCDLVCPNLQRHYLVLLATLLKYNKMYTILDEAKLSEKIVGVAKRFPALSSWVFWIVASHQYTINALEKALECEFTEENALPLCSMLANFVAVSTNHEALKLLAHHRLGLLAAKVFEVQFNHELVRELQLTYNNLLSKSIECFAVVCQNQLLLEKLLNQDTEETWVTIYILNEASKGGYSIPMPIAALEQKSQLLKAPCPLNPGHPPQNSEYLKLY